MQQRAAWDLNAEIDFAEIDPRNRALPGELDADPRLYTTTIAMQDIDRVRRAMGYDQINIMGVSYGTRAAQVYLRQFPDTVRTMTLDSVVPMQLALGQEHAPMLDRAVDHGAGRLRRRCRLPRRSSPTRREELAALFQQLREQPRQITITHPVTGQPQALLADRRNPGRGAALF